MNAAPAKPVLAIVANAPSPYRLHQHGRIAREMPEIEMHSIFLHEFNAQPWDQTLPPEINPVHFGPGESMMTKNKGLGPLRSWQKAGRVIKWLKKHKADAVIITGYNDPGLMRLIAWCRRTKTPSFMFNDSNVHGDRATGLSRPLKNMYVSWVVRSLTGLMPCGTFGERFFHRYGSKGKPVFYMPHEPDYQKIFDVTPADVARLKAEHDIDPNRRHIMYSGRLVNVKRVDTLIDAFAKIAEQRPDYDLLIVGDGVLRAELEQRVPDPIKNRVVWTGFIDGREDLSALYRCGDVFVLPSSYEPWAVVVCEAAAAQLAMVCSDVVGAGAELVRDGVNGRLFPPGDVDRLAEALLDVTADEARLESMQRASADVLADWRKRGDPVDGVRKALQFSGVLPKVSGADAPTAPAQGAAT